ALVLWARTVERALRLAEGAGLAAAVLDFRLGDGDCQSVCERFRARGIPFVIYSGYTNIRSQFPSDMTIAKPADLRHVVDAVTSLLGANDHTPVRPAPRFPSMGHAQR